MRRVVSIDEITDTGEVAPEARQSAEGVVDARWEQSESNGEETAGGSMPTPDQDVVDEIGKAAGVTYEEGEPLRVGEKEQERDEHRWELDPASAEDFASRSSEAAREAEPVPATRHRGRYTRAE